MFSDMYATQIMNSRNNYIVCCQLAKRPSNFKFKSSISMSAKYFEICELFKVQIVGRF